MKIRKWTERTVLAALLSAAMLLCSGCGAAAAAESEENATEPSMSVFGQLSVSEAEPESAREVSDAEEPEAASQEEAEALSEPETSSAKVSEADSETEASIEEASAEESLEPEESEAPEESKAPDADTVSELEQQVSAMVSSFSGTWSVYLKRLDTGESFAIQDTSMVAASLIKLYVYGTAAQQIEEGKLSKDYYTSTMLPMISVSDNTACNTMIDAVGGMTAVNSFIAAQGWTVSQLNRKMLAPDPVENYTSVSECGDLLERVYNGTYVSAEASQNLLDAMLAQTRCTKIPAGLPQGTKCANKTGELSDVENDVAIVFSPACTYILCVMSDDISSGTAQSNIASISKTIYDYLNP